MYEFLLNMSTAELVASVALVIYSVCILVWYIKTLKKQKQQIKANRKYED